MSPQLASLYEAVKALPPAEVRELVGLLARDLGDLAPDPEDGPPPVLSEAWRQEIARRIEDYKAGREESVAWEDVKARWAARRTARG